VCRMLWIAEQKGYAPALISQTMYSLLTRGIEQEYLAMCKQFGISTIAFSPLAAGLLTGKHQREKPLPGGRFDRVQLHYDRYWHGGIFDAVDDLRAAAARAGRIG